MLSEATVAVMRAFQSFSAWLVCGTLLRVARGDTSWGQQAVAAASQPSRGSGKGGHEGTLVPGHAHIQPLAMLRDGNFGRRPHSFDLGHWLGCSRGLGRNR